MAQKEPICSGGPTYSPDKDYYEGCPVFGKVRHVVIPKGVTATVEWELRKPDGVVLDLSSCFPPPQGSTSDVKVRVTDLDRSVVSEVTGTVVDAANGLISFQIPSEINSYSGIYELSIAVFLDDNIVFMENGLVSVEDSLWGESGLQKTGPPTIREFRTILRDTAIENEFWDAVEYNIGDIVFALTMPIRQWNETPPNVGNYTTKTFPWRYYWLRGAIAHLLEMALHHYARTSANINAGGLAGNFKNKFGEYSKLYELYKQEWERFLYRQKARLNISRGWGVIGSGAAEEL